MKKLILLASIVFFNCANKSNNDTNIKDNTVTNNDSIVCVNKNIKMVLFIENKSIAKFKLYNTDSQIKLEGKPELITIDGEIPEGTNRIDYNNPSDYRGYECDSTYQFINDKIKIAFALEKKTKKRLDLTIYDSSHSVFKDGDYTLVNQK
jgi:hypothetical protein